MITAFAVLFTVGAVIEAIERHWVFSGIASSAAVILWLTPH